MPTAYTRERSARSLISRIDQSISSASPEWYARGRRLGSPLQPRKWKTLPFHPRIFTRCMMAREYAEFDDPSRP
jgi:hypothetical protein